MFEVRLLFVLSMFKIVYLSNVVQISNVLTKFGESPFWCSETQSLYYVDIFGTDFDIFRYDYNQNIVYSAKIIGESFPAFIIPVKDKINQFSVGFSSRIVKIIQWDGISQIAIVLYDLFAVEQDPIYSTNHWHHAKADPKGRFFGGTFRQELCSFSSAINASFYRFTRKRGVQRIMGNIKVSDGLAWNENSKKFYYTDGCNGILREYDWSPKTGTICNGRTIFKFAENIELLTTTPLGLTIDRNGDLYSAMFNGSSVLKINPRTKRFQVIELPTQVVIGVTFGGPNLNILFVTTGSTIYNIYSGTPSNDTLTSSAGALFMISGLGVQGYAGRKLCI